ncbi:unnamed protein product [Aphanomyces euteiches]
MDTPVPVVPVASVVAAPPQPSVVDSVEKPLMAKPALVPVLLDGQGDALLSTFAMDLLVKRTSAIVGKQDWVWRQIVLCGQKMEVFKNTKLVDCFYMQHCDIQESTPYTFDLYEHGEVKLSFFIASATLRDRFLSIFHASTTTMYWSRPASTLMDDMIAVATSIVEAAAVRPPMKAPEVPASGITVSQVQTYLAHLKGLYDTLPAFATKEDMYGCVLELEASYLANPTEGLGHEILKLYPEYASRAADGSLERMTVQLNCSQCPQCQKPFHHTTTFNLHVGGKTLICDACENWIHYETFKLAQMRQEIPTFDFKIGIPLFQTKRSLPMPQIPRDGKAKTYMDRLWRIVFEDECLTHHRVTYSAKFALEERMIANLNRLDLVQLIYRQLLFMGQIVTNFDYWNHPTVIQAAIHRYDKFRVLANAPKAQNLAATLDIILVGQTHQQTSSRAVLPIDKGSDSILVRLGDTAFAWGEAFNEAYSSCAMDVDEWVQTKPGNEEVQHRMLRNQWAKYCRLPSRDCRFVGVEEIYPSELIGLESPEDTVAVSVIGALETDINISRGKFRAALPADASRIYTYRYTREVRTLLEKMLSPGWY